MISEISYGQALNTLRKILENKKNQQTQWRETNNNRDLVLARYQPLFSPDNLPNLALEDFTSFLYLENNKHWSPLYRQKNQITADMAKLRRALFILTDESRPIADRLDELRPSGREPFIKGLSRAVLTPILLVVYPDKYGVWNNTSMNGLKKLNIWLEIRSSSFGENYEAVNQVLTRLKNDLGVDYWVLDELWWEIKVPEEVTETELDVIGDEYTEVSGYAHAFGLEKYLQEFIVSNWEKIEQLDDWTLYEEEDELVGVEYPTSVGRIDLLAKHKTQPKWLVIELKRDQSSDQTLGQVQRYLGWVKQHLAKPGESVSGLIICQSISEKLKYAWSMTNHLDVMLYDVNFKLQASELFRGEIIG